MELFSNHRIGVFSLRARRLFVGLALAPCGIAVANIYLRWGLFGAYERHAVAAAFVVLYLVMRYLGPTMAELRERREGIRSAKTSGR